MRYLLIIYGEFKNKIKLIKKINEGISIISDLSDTKYTYGDKTIIINFNSSLDDEDVRVYTDELIHENSNLYLLIPYEKKIHSSLPSDIYDFLFNETETSNIYNKEIIDCDNEIELDLDGILEKIHIHGTNSLTEKERLTLEKYSTSI